MNHYYLVSSLPALSLGERPGVTCAEFLLRAAQQVGGAEYERLRACVEEDQVEGTDPLSREWQAVETALRNACARQRATRRGLDPRPHLRDGELDPALEAGVAAAFNARDPLERERALDTLRWTALERMAGFDPFTFRALQTYATRLRLAWRWAGLDADRGRAVAARIAGLPSPEPAGIPSP